MIQSKVFVLFSTSQWNTSPIFEHKFYYCCSIVICTGRFAYYYHNNDPQPGLIFYRHVKVISIKLFQWSTGRKSCPPTPAPIGWLPAVNHTAATPPVHTVLSGLFDCKWTLMYKRNVCTVHETNINHLTQKDGISFLW